MRRRVPTSWEKAARSLRDRVEETLDRWSEAVKDAILDWDPDDEPTEPPLPLEELPPLAPEQFVEALRGPVEETLRQVAETINAAPTGHLVAASEDRLTELFADLWCEALRVGIQLRLDAAEAARPDGEKLQGEWARRYRHMRVTGDGLPLTHHPGHQSAEEE
jgi:hypothetical protein